MAPPTNRDSVNLLIKGTAALLVIPMGTLYVIRDQLQERGVDDKWRDICATFGAVLALQVVLVWFGFAAWNLDKLADAEARNQLPPSPLPVEPIQTKGWQDIHVPECPLSSPRKYSHSLPASLSPRKSPLSPGRTLARLRMGSFSGKPGKQEPSPQRLKLEVPADVESMDVELRVAVAPWLAQDDALASPKLAAFVDGCEVCVVDGAVVADGEDVDIELRAKVAPWVVQGANVVEQEVVVEVPEPARERSASLLALMVKNMSPRAGRGRNQNEE